jgi:molybdenum cofactor biosynthesis protein MoaC
MTATIQVRLFGILRERCESDSIDLELTEGETVAEALEALRQVEPIGELLERLPVRMAVNREYADAATRLRAEDELALVPPISGGAIHAHIREDSISPLDLVKTVGDPGAGAIVMFAGVTRTVDHLHYEAYREMAEQRMASILEECAKRHDLSNAVAEHRIGEVPRGEPAVVVAVSAAHRGEAFSGAREVIDRIKAEAPIWKREAEAGGGTRWVEGTAAPEAGASTDIGGLNHLDPQGRARMVDVGGKRESERIARARSRVRLSPEVARAVERGNGPKGEVLGVARLAGIQAAKQTGSLIPLAHPISLTYAGVSVRVDAPAGLVEIVAEVRTVARTGVEMEAMSACAVAALTVYDMVKGLEQGVEIEQVTLLEKRGGRSDWRREEAEGEPK